MEWQRSCEEVRRFAPGIGRLGQWKALCDGGWVGPVPDGLPGDEAEGTQPTQPTSVGDARESATAGSAQNLDIPIKSSSAPSQALESPQAQRPMTSSRPPSAYSQPRHVETVQDQEVPLIPPRPITDNRMDSIASITTLTSFPAPPTHFPIPPPFSESKLRPQQPSGQSAGESSSASHSPMLESGRNAESPLPLEEEERRGPEASFSVSTGSREEPQVRDSYSTGDRNVLDNEQSLASNGRPSAEVSYSNTSANDAPRNAISHASQMPQNLPPGDYFSDEDREFGYRDHGQPRAKTIDALRTRGVERNESVASNGSVVTSLRNRYTTTVSRYIRLR